MIGGGPSLRHFDWAYLKNRNTVGCNHAFQLGADVCKVAVFCDNTFLRDYRSGLSFFEGPVVTNHPTLQVGWDKERPAWLISFKRRKTGLSADPEELGYNASTGACAIHLALKLGAATVYLLGFDMSGSNDNQNNWHAFGGITKEPEVYQRHMEGLKAVANAIPSVYPQACVIQLCSGKGLGIFPIEDICDHFGAVDANIQCIG